MTKLPVFSFVTKPDVKFLPTSHESPQKFEAQMIFAHPILLFLSSNQILIFKNYLFLKCFKMKSDLTFSDGLHR